jgi:hypothetical protein
MLRVASFKYFSRRIYHQPGRALLIATKNETPLLNWQALE